MNESEIEDFLEQYPDIIEEGLKVLERQKRTEFGVIDLFCEDKNQNKVVIELKISPTTNTVSQLAKYIVALVNEGYKKEELRAMLVARTIDTSVRAVCNFFDFETKGLSLANISNIQSNESTVILKKVETKLESKQTTINIETSKKEVESLTDRELTILYVMAKLNMNNIKADYPTIAQELGISQTTVRDFMRSIIRKIPIIRKKVLPNGLSFILPPEARNLLKEQFDHIGDRIYSFKGK